MKKILVIRNDKLGDFMLAWPSFAMLKESLPQCEITALVPSYTAPLAQICPFIDKVIIDAGKDAVKDEKLATLNAIKAEKFDASINLVSDPYNAWLVWKAKIPYRLAPATKLIQFLYNKRITQRRSQSAKPEFEYNLDLIRAFLNDKNITIVEPKPPYLQFSTAEISQQREKLITQLALDPAKKWIFMHCGTGGSAKNLSLNQYAAIASGLNLAKNCQIILTAGPNEKEKAQELAQLTGLDETQIKIYAENDGLVDFARSLACADLFIAGSTGPLHLSAALNCRTVGFFPTRRSAIALRWTPINMTTRHLAFSPPVNQDRNTEMGLIQPQEVVAKICEFWRD